MTAPKLHLVPPRSQERAPTKKTTKAAAGAAPSPETAKPDANNGPAGPSHGASGSTPSVKAKAARTKKTPAAELGPIAADVMSVPAIACQAHDTLNLAAQRLWDNNLGALVVVDEHGKPVSMLTDRDICFAAYTQGVPLWGASVSSAMSPRVVTCTTHTPLEQVRALMMQAQVRRLPVVNAAGQVAGVIGLADLSRPLTASSSAARKGSAGDKELLKLVGALYQKAAAS